MKQIVCIILLLTSLFAEFDEAKVYWVGHSLISAKDWNDNKAMNLIEQMEFMANAEGKEYAYHKHTIPGAPIGWNWGVSSSWAQVEPLIAPLTNSAHAEYGTFDAIVVTEGVNIQSSYDYWSSSFYARKFYNAAKRANPSCRLFLYESWHHFNASDFQNYYGPQESFNWIAYMKQVRPTWEAILNEAADPAKTAEVSDYTYQGSGEDPGNGDDMLEINIIPTGKVFVAVMERLLENRPEDDWSFEGAVHNGELSGVDFFVNPLIDFPNDLSTTVQSGDLDDIHPSQILIYLNSLTHYAVIYQKNPKDIPTTAYVPENIATIFKTVVWDVVTNDPLTGVEGEKTSILQSNSPSKRKHLSHVNGVLHITTDTKEVLMLCTVSGKSIKRISLKSGDSLIDMNNYAPGVYLVTMGSNVLKILR